MEKIQGARANAREYAVTHPSVIEVVAGDRPQPGLAPRYRVRYGLRSEIGHLEAVLVHRPGPEVLKMDERYPWKWICDGKPDLARAQEEHDVMIEAIQAGGADVYYLEEGESVTDLPLNEWFSRDQGFMTPHGAVLANMAPPRVGEEWYVARRLLELDIPIILRIFGGGRLEPGDVIYLDPDTLLIGQSYRSNPEGYRQVKDLLEGRVVEQVVPVPLRHHVMHLDTVFNVASRKVAALYRPAVREDFVQFVQSKGFAIVDVPEEEYNTLATNWLCLSPGRVLFIDGEEINRRTRAELEKRGIEVVGLKIPELLQGAGGPRCMTFPLARWGDDLANW